jgi:hypothetical protein
LVADAFWTNTCPEPEHRREDEVKKKKKEGKYGKIKTKKSQSKNEIVTMKQTIKRRTPREL